MIKKLVFFILVISCSGCAGMYIEKHLTIKGTNIRTPYGKGNVTIQRDFYFGKEWLKNYSEK